MDVSYFKGFGNEGKTVDFIELLTAIKDGFFL